LQRAVRAVNCRTGSLTARFRTFSQAPLAVRSAGGCGRGWKFPSAACAGRTFHPDKRNPLGLAIQVHRFRDVSGTAAIRAVVRAQPSPLCGRSIFHDSQEKFARDHSLLRITNKLPAGNMKEQVLGQQ